MVIKKGGKKGKKGKKPTAVNEVERELVFKAEDQEYCQVVKLLGNCRLEGKCFDGKTRLCHIRGSMTKKKVWIKVNDIVLVSLREFEDAKCDVLYLYNQKEIKRLQTLGEIPFIETEDELKDTGFEYKNGDEEDDGEEEKKVEDDLNIDFI
jgi:translation initiation factor 1A